VGFLVSWGPGGGGRWRCGWRGGFCGWFLGCGGGICGVFGLREWGFRG